MLQINTDLLAIKGHNKHIINLLLPLQIGKDKIKFIQGYICIQPKKDILQKQYVVIIIVFKMKNTKTCSNNSRNKAKKWWHIKHKAFFSQPYKAIKQKKDQHQL